MNQKSTTNKFATFILLTPSVEKRRRCRRRAQSEQSQGQGSRNEIVQLQLNMKFVATQSIDQHFYNQQQKQQQQQFINIKHACKPTTLSSVSVLNNSKRVLCNKNNKKQQKQQAQLQQRQYWKHKRFCIAAS